MVNHPDRDPAFWTLVKTQCSWEGRLDPKAFLEWDVEKAWNRRRDGILVSLKCIRPLSDRLEVIVGNDAEVLKSYPDAVALIHDPFSSYDDWNKALREKWNSEPHQEKLLRILSSRKGRWIFPCPADEWREKCERMQVGAAWMVIIKLSSPKFRRRPVIVGDRQFATEQNERSFAE